MREGSPPYDRYHPLHSRSCHNEKEERGKRGESSEGRSQIWGGKRNSLAGYSQYLLSAHLACVPVITGNGRRKRVTCVWWPLLQSLFLGDAVSCCGTWQLPPTGAAQGSLLRLSTSRSTWCQGKAYGRGHSACSAAPGTKAWLLQTLPQKTSFSYIHKL